MKKISLKTQSSYIEMFCDDIELIKSAFLAQGYEITDRQAVSLWRECSQEWFAEWIDPEIYTQQEIFDMVNPLFEEDDSEEA